MENKSEMPSVEGSDEQVKKDPKTTKLLEACGDYLLDEDRKRIEGMDFHEAAGNIGMILDEKGHKNWKEILLETGLFEE